MSEKNIKRSAKPSAGLRWLMVLVVIIGFGIILIKPSTELVYKKLYPKTYKEEIEAFSAEYDVDPNLIYAVARIESNFDPEAHSKADARGVMQMTKDAFEWVQYRMKDESGVTYDEIFNPAVGIKYGTYMLKLLLDEMGSEELAVCAYHAGMSNVRSWLKKTDYSMDGVTLDKIPYKDTQWYYDKVFEAKEIYERIY